MKITAIQKENGSGVIDVFFDLPRTTSKTPPIKLGAQSWVIEVRCITEGPPGLPRGITCLLVNMNSYDVVVDFTVDILNAYALNGFNTPINEIYNRAGSAKKMKIKSRRGFELFYPQALSTFNVRVTIQAVETGFVQYERNSAPFVEGNWQNIDQIFPPDIFIRTCDERVQKSAPDDGIPAHKVILSLHSPVFRAMFKTGMREATSTTILISDFSEPVVREFVQFLYADRSAKSALQVHGMQLLAMADKYQVSSLSAVCVSYLSSHLTEANVFHALTLADSCGATVLKAKALSYIRDHLQAVSTSGNFTDLSAELVKDVLKALAQRR
jgi:hypothetical protein